MKGIKLIAMIWITINSIVALGTFLISNHGIPSECHGKIPIEWNDTFFAIFVSNMICMFFIWTFRKKLQELLNI